MSFPEVVKHCGDICAILKQREPDRTNFYEYAKQVGYLATQLSKSQRESLPWLYPWASRFRELSDDFEALWKADRMLLYAPKNKHALAFHQSQAYLRYFRAGNRTSKTQSGFAEDYYALTGFHPYRAMAPGQASVVLVSGLPFTDYEPSVWSKKLFYGEDRNVLSPMFPEGGKWFHRYDGKQRILTLACRECAEAGKAGSCPGHHSKPTIALVSSEKGVSVLEAFSVRLAHIDEHCPDGFLPALQMRVADQAGDIIITGTPLTGPDSWEAKIAAKAERPPELNHFDPEDPTSRPYASLHTCSQFEGNIVSHDVIRAEMAGMDDFEIESRVYGRPAALAKKPVFDRKILADMRSRAQQPTRGYLKCPIDLREASETTEMNFVLSQIGALRVWERPKAGAQYVLGVDTAAGLVDGDASCCSVIKIDVKDGRLSLRMVAQLHGWMGMFDYADGVFQLAVWYNSGLVVVELTGGLGRGVIERLKGGKSGEGLCYWNLFRDTQKGEYAQFSQDMRFGLDTSAFSKPSMIGALQQLIRDGNFTTQCTDTIAELVAYAQETTDMGNVRFRGAGGTHDDRVMSLVLGCYVAISFPVYDFGADVVVAAQQVEKTKERGPGVGEGGTW